MFKTAIRLFNIDNYMTMDHGQLTMVLFITIFIKSDITAYTPVNPISPHKAACT